MTLKSNLDEAELRKNVHIKRSSDLEWIISVKSYPEPVVENLCPKTERLSMVDNGEGLYWGNCIMVKL